MVARGDRTTPLPPNGAPSPSASHSAEFTHQLRNRLFALSALFDVLELRADGSAAVGRYLPHLRLELSRLERFAEDWTEEGLGEPAAGATLELPGVLAEAMQRVAEEAAMRDVFLSLVSAPEARRPVRRPALVTAVFAQLLRDAVRAATPGTHVWVRMARLDRGEVTIEMCASGECALAAPGVELAQATLRALGGDLALVGGAGERASEDATGTPFAVIRLGGSA